MKKYTQFLLCLTVFVLIAIVRRMPCVITFDNWIYVLALKLSYPNTWIIFWESVSYFGEGRFVYPLLTAAGVLFFLKHRSLRSICFLALMTTLFFINLLIKLMYHLDRPVSLSPYSDLTTYSFPSGHAFNSVILFYFLPRFLCYVVHGRVARIFLTRSFIAVGVLLIGLSRVFLGAHWFSDVCGGWALGATVAIFLIATLRQVES